MREIVVLTAAAAAARHLRMLLLLALVWKRILAGLLTRFSLVRLLPTLKHAFDIYIYI